MQRAVSVGSVDRIVPASELRPYLIDAVERGMRRTLAQIAARGIQRLEPAPYTRIAFTARNSSSP